VELTPIAHVRLPVDLGVESLRVLTRELQEALASPAPVVAISGAAPDTFCLGLAIGSNLQGAPTNAFADVLSTMHHAPKPLLAIVDGRAIGGGMGLACACDWVIATERATFALPELVWGLMPAIIWPVLTDRMAPHTVRQWTISAHSRPVTEAQLAGLVDTIILGSPSGSQSGSHSGSSSETALDRAIERSARMLHRLDAAALQRLRSWARESRRHDLPTALQLGSEITATMLREPSVQRRWQAFVAGESPWSG
jgi:enoyl-CoA hydratase/carnithine racemase